MKNPTVPRTEDIFESVLHVVTKATGVPYHVIASKARGSREIADARALAMYLMHKVCHVTVIETGKVFGKDHTTVTYACRKVVSIISYDQTMKRLVDQTSSEVRKRVVALRPARTVWDLLGKVNTVFDTSHPYKSPSNEEVDVFMTYLQRLTDAYLGNPPTWNVVYACNEPGYQEYVYTDGIRVPDGCIVGLETDSGELDMFPGIRYSDE
jgi:hypothetical protein